MIETEQNESTTRNLAAFWSGETIEERLPILFEPHDTKRIDCAAYTLSVGPEVYVSPSEQSADPDLVTIRKLDKEEGFTIPAGQFALLLTEEVVTVPTDALAFISIRARTKFRGLVNVSGFHVDPGYCGQLTFSVYNAGPSPVHLKRGQPIFLIWFASLDRESIHRKDETVHRGIDPEIVTSISGELHSFAGLASRIVSTEKSLTERVHAIEKEQVFWRFIGSVLVAGAVGLSINWIWTWISNM